MRISPPLREQITVVDKAFIKEEIFVSNQSEARSWKSED